MQQYVYHMVPNEMEGEKLIPLNFLKNPYPQLYEKYIKNILTTLRDPNCLENKFQN
ncbi:hypothetical protein SAMN05443252_105199 [Bacillus sp. OV322]|nr:hypothetical protein SAMN05443252_105199 [Bacillus sp. OV322]